MRKELSLRNYDFLAIVPYVSVSESFVPACNFVLDNNFFIFLQKWRGKAFAGTPFEKDHEIDIYTPDFSGNIFSSTFAHELTHLLGATDKYGTVPGIDCINDPQTGKPYSGYDIMCHRVDGQRPLLKDLIISSSTAKEIGWLK